MAIFANTLSPTPFGVFDSETSFQTEADNMIVFVKRRLGDCILSVELTKKQIWSAFEEASMEYNSIINQYQAEDHLMTYLGYPTGSLDSGTNLYPRENLEFILRKSEPYAMEAGLGGSYDSLSGSIQLEQGRQDYDLYEEMLDTDGNLVFSSSLNATPRSKMKIMEVFHFSPTAAYRFFNTSAAINYLHNEFGFSGFQPEVVFSVLPVFEDVLRGQQLKLSARIRRSNYSYKIVGKKIRIYPMPVYASPRKLFFRVQFHPDPLNPAFQDDTITGVSNLSNIPFGNIPYAQINSMGRQWIRQFCLAICKEILGRIRRKMQTIPIPGGDLTLDGDDLLSRGREEKDKFITQLNEKLTKLTHESLLEKKAKEAESLQKILRTIPMPDGKVITVF